jgi:outer membrane protein assembly factor BamB
MEEQRERGESGRARAGCVVGLLTLLVGALLGVGLTLGALGVGWGVLFGRVFNPGGSPVVAVGPMATPEPQAIPGGSPGRRYLPVPPIPLDSDTPVPDLLVISRNYDREASTIAYMSPSGDGVRWESAPLGDGGEYSWVVSYSDEVVVVAVETRLLGLSRASGERLWEAPLTDGISPNICADCLQVFGDVVVALPQDGELQAFSVANGAPRWRVTLREATRQIVRAGDLLGVPDDRADDGSGSVLRLFDPRDGAEAEPFTPECPEPSSSTYMQTPSYYSPIGQDPDGRLLLWLIGSSAPCLLSVDAETREVVGRTYLDEFFNTELGPQTTLWAGDTLYLSDGRQIAAVAPQGVRVLLAEESYTLSPLAVGDGTLLVLAQRTRGSSRYELWAVDIASGQRRWERIFTATDPLGAGGDTGSFTAALVGDAVGVLELQGEDEQLVYELIALSDGASRARSTIGTADLGDDLRGAVWSRERLVLVTDELYTIDLATGQVLFRWPEENF